MVETLVLNEGLIMSISSLAGIPDEDAWFHDNTSREEAERLLMEIGKYFSANLNKAQGVCKAKHYYF